MLELVTIISTLQQIFWLQPPGSQDRLLALLLLALNMHLLAMGINLQDLYYSNWKICIVQIQPKLLNLLQFIPKIFLTLKSLLVLGIWIICIRLFINSGIEYSFILRTKGAHEIRCVILNSCQTPENVCSKQNKLCSSYRCLI